MPFVPFCRCSPSADGHAIACALTIPIRNSRGCWKSNWGRLSAIVKRPCSRNSMHSMSWRDLGLIAQAEVFVECRREPLPTIAKHLQEHFRGVGLEADLAAAGFSPTVLTSARCAGCGHDFLVACSCVRAPGLTSAKLPVKSRRLRSGPVPAWRLQAACLLNRQSR